MVSPGQRGRRWLGTHHFAQALVELVHDDVQPRELSDHAAQLLTGVLAHLGALLCTRAHVLHGDHGAQVQRLRVLTDGVGFSCRKDVGQSQPGWHDGVLLRALALRGSQEPENGQCPHCSPAPTTGLRRSQRHGGQASDAAVHRAEAQLR